MGIPSIPPSNRYASSSIYGFYMQEEDEQLAISLIVESGNYVALTLAPQQLSVSEPFATAVSFRQGGGKFVESRGQIIKQARIAGTTGYIPTPSAASRIRIPTATSTGRNLLADTSQAAEDSRADRSGFAAFHSLRQLFRRFGEDRRDGKIPRLFYFDTKDDEYWEIEPMLFSMSRNSRRPMLYDYEIQFVCLEITEDEDQTLFGDFTSIVSSALIGLPGVSQIEAAASLPAHIKGVSFAGSLGTFFNNILTGKPPYAATIRRYAEMAQNGLGFLKLVSGSVKGAFQGLLSTIGAVVQVFDDVATTAKELASVPVSILRQLESSIRSCFFVLAETQNTPEAIADNVREEWNEFLLELQTLNDQMICGFDKFGDSYTSDSASVIQDFSRTSSNGSSTDLMEETGTPLTVNPFLGAMGVDAVIDVQKLVSSDGYRTAYVLSGETIYDVARRELKNVHRFMELVFINGLEFPFIVPSSTSKPSATLAWGEPIKIPIKTNGRSAAFAGPPGAPLSALSGVVTATGSTTEVVSTGNDPAWRDDQWAGFTITLTSGAGAVDGERIVVSNTVDTLVVNRPWSISPAISDTFSVSLREFSLGIASSPEAIAYGRDWLLKFSKSPDGSTSPYKATLMLDASGNIATVAGMENFMQAMLLRASTSQGSHPFHASYGFPDFVGRPMTPEIVPLYTYMARQSLLQDPRTDTVESPLLQFNAGAFTFDVEVKPVNAQRSKSLFLGSAR